VVRARKHLVVGFFLAIGLIALASRGLVSAYSYWSDEAFTVATVNSDWLSMFRDWMIPDTAPPLYSVMLKIWVSVFGSSEITTRAFSLLCVSISLVVLVLASWKKGLVAFYASILFLGTAPFFSRYGQESRNYGLVLLLASVSVSLLLNALYVSDQSRESGDRWLPWFRLSLLALSLSHYFALVYAFSLLFSKAVFQLCRACYSRKDLEIDLATSVVMLAWPVYHFGVAGNLSSSYSAFSWNQVYPISGTISNLISGLLPVAQGSFLLSLLTVVAAAALFCFVYAYPKASNPIKLEIFFLLASSLAFVVLIAGIDCFKPLSTDRNFIVLAPAATLVIANSLQVASRFGNKSLFVCCGALFGYLLIQQYNISANNLLGGKLVPYENYKSLSAMVFQSDLCERGKCFTYRTGTHVNRVYFASSRSAVVDIPVFPDKADVTSTYIMSRHGYLGIKDRIIPPLTCYQPVQAWDMATVLLTSSSNQRLLEKGSIHPCQAR
jgi:hypothetical protein